MEMEMDLAMAMEMFFNSTESATHDSNSSTTKINWKCQVTETDTNRSPLHGRINLLYAVKECRVSVSWPMTNLHHSMYFIIYATL